jgi:DNA-binding beta-propeller fold protein YncE
MRVNALCFATLIAAGCAQTGPSTKSAAPAAMQSIALPGAPPEGVFMDYIAYDRAHKRVWVPAGNTAKVAVIDVTNQQVSTVEGFPTQEMERRGKKRIVGPSSATVGDGVVFVGNRGDFTVCAVDATSLQKGACAKLDQMPDGLAWVGSAKEVWVTTPRDKSIIVLDASAPGALTVKTKISFEGEPEGFAVDDERGLFFTNLEDKDRTLAVDVKTHQVSKTWMPNCGEDGPKGLALDHALDFLFVACADKVKVLDAGHDGKELSMIATGDGVDNIDYLESKHELYAGAARAAKLTVATIDQQGKLQPKAVVATTEGARNAVVTDEGAAYLTDSKGGKILVVTPK